MGGGVYAFRIWDFGEIDGFLAARDMGWRPGAFRGRRRRRQKKVVVMEWREKEMEGKWDGREDKEAGR